MVAVAMMMSAACTEKPVSVSDLTVEMRENPEGIDVMVPRLSWKVKDQTPGAVQTSYRIEVAGAGKDLKAGRNLVWDSGEVTSSESVLVPYAGESLDYDADYFWRVKVSTRNGTSAWSKPARWSTGLKDTTEWGARWIGVDEKEKLRVDENHLAAHYLRKEFRLDGKVTRAKLYFCALGMGIVSINGEKPCDDVFAHPPVLFDKVVYYRTYDVTDFVHRGVNTLGVVLGNGRYQHLSCMTLRGVANPRLLLCLKVKYADGREEKIVSDASWMGTSMGPITCNNEFDGEDYDARLDLGKWDRKGYRCNPEIWKPVDMMGKPKGELKAMAMDDMAVQDEVKGKTVLSTADGRHIVDFGQNMVGYAAVRLSGKKGETVTIRYAEKLNASGDSLDMSNLRAAQATDHYIPAADGEFSWSPVFPYHGFRYIEISGVTEAPVPVEQTGKVVYDKMKVLGSFTCSDERLNQLYHNMFWGIRSNYRGMPVDCPQRDERQGWLGDRGATVYGEPYMFGVQNLYRKWMNDIFESMKKGCRISVVSPRNWAIFNDDTAASAVFVYIADMLYSRFGDKSGIETYYPVMKAWLEYITDKNLHDGIFTMKYDEYRDWCVPPESLELIHSKDPSRQTSSELIHTGVLCDVLGKMIGFASLTGNNADIPAYQSMLAEVKVAFNRKFFDEETARYDNNTVTANLIPLAFGIVPEGREMDVMSNIVEKTEKEYGGHVSTGNVGIRYLMQTLTNYGQLELAYRLATQDTYPGWGYMIKNGATTVWELWNGDAADPAMNSGNHVMMIGDLLSWYYENLAGIRNDPSDVAFRKIWLQPAFPSQLSSVDASYETPYGTVRSAWTLDYDYDRIEWNITVPTGSSATAVLPACLHVDTEGLESDMVGDAVFIKLPSGTYTLKTK